MERWGRAVIWSLVFGFLVLGGPRILDYFGFPRWWMIFPIIFLLVYNWREAKQSEEAARSEPAWSEHDWKKFKELERKPR
jgi:hypothetical protein